MYFLNGGVKVQSWVYRGNCGKLYGFHDHSDSYSPSKQLAKSAILHYVMWQ